MYLAKNGFIPPSEWIHDKFLKNKEGKTVEDFMKETE